MVLALAIPSASHFIGRHLEVSFQYRLIILPPVRNNDHVGGYIQR
jgi:hypothetical protein